ncbi:MAG: hypothetical protein ACR2ME_10240 [Acidimicrobiia bacterium]
MTLGTIVLMFSYFAYAAAFSSVDGQTTIDAQLVGLAVLIAPFVFVVVALVSRNPRPKLVLLAMLLLVLIALPIGLLAPILGASAGFGVGIALVLAQPDVANVLRRRIFGVLFAVAYAFVLLIVATPAGVFTGAVLPSILIGLADEYGAWRVSRESK